MPAPRLLARINKRVFNPREIRKEQRPVLHHVGRSSGVEYHTPLDAHEVEDGYAFIMVYGERSDWVRNILASGTARLTVDGDTVQLSEPEVAQLDDVLAADVKRPPGFMDVTEVLRMRTAA